MAAAGDSRGNNVAVGGGLSDAAIHPDGTTYVSEYHIFGTSFLVKISPNGTSARYSLPQGRFTQVDSGTCGRNKGVSTSAYVSNPIIRDDGTVVLLAHASDSFKQVSSSPVNGSEVLCNESIISLGPDKQFAYVIEHSGTSISVRSVDITLSDIPSQNLDQYQLLPDGHGGLLFANRQRPLVYRLDSNYRVAAKNNTFVTDSSQYYETEYVLGEDAAYAVVNSYVTFTTPNPYRSRVLSFDPQTLQVIYSLTDLGTPKPVPQHIRLKFGLSGGGAYAVGPATAYVVNASIDTTGYAMGGSASPIGQGAWGGWNGPPALQLGTEPAFGNASWVYTADAAFFANAMSPRPLTTSGLRELAASVGIPQTNRDIGLAFQDFALWSIYNSAEPNNIGVSTPERAQQPGGVGTTIPDWIGGVVISNYQVFTRSMFADAKAVNGTLTLDHSRYQMLGFLEAAHKSPLALGTSTWPSFTFLTTADTYIGGDALVEANLKEVQIRQRTALRFPGGLLSFGPEYRLNPTPASQGTWPMLHILANIGRLGAHPWSGPRVDYPPDSPNIEE